ncbi:hypothetical protein LXA43DRAFT_636894 [Ganoderma leucocontextum]|nr:hypothetical protein LXA43DRAFT_636894 [Ganoderma leucocontextum]
MSSRLQHTDPAEQRHELSDDLESFIHVLNYCALKYLPNDLSYDGGALVPSFIDRIYDSVREADGMYEGSTQKLQMLTEN